MPSVSLKLLRFRDNHHDISIFIIVDIVIIIVDIIENGNNNNRLVVYVPLLSAMCGDDWLPK